MQPWRLEELNYGQVKANPPFEVAVLPLGATEPHNLHLPYGTDTFQVETIAAKACALAHQAGARVLELPAMPYGTETNQMKFPLAMNLNPSTAGASDHRLSRFAGGSTGSRRCVILNGHGGNDLKWVLRELHRQTPVHIFLCNWFKMASDVYETIFDEKDDHAGEMETSMGLAHFPRLVALEQADSGAVKPSRFEAVNRGWVEITRPWHLLTTNSGAGNPRAATAAKGEQFTTVVAERLGRFLTELAQSPLDDTFPFQNTLAAIDRTRRQAISN